jgi:hypothetical protein
MPLELRPDGTLAGFENLEQALEARRRIIEQDMALGRPATKNEPTETDPEQAKKGFAFIRALAEHGGDVQSTIVAKALGLDDAKGLSAYARAARTVLLGKFQARQLESVMRKQKERERGSVWKLDVAKVKEVGLLT